jgi:transposase-like protein
MKRRRHSPKQIVRLLAEGEKLLGEGQTIDEVARHLEINESTWHRWRNQYGGMKADDAKELRDLRKENQRLKKIVADLSLDNDMLKELNRGNF